MVVKKQKNNKHFFNYKKFINTNNYSKNDKLFIFGIILVACCFGFLYAMLHMKFSYDNAYIFYRIIDNHDYLFYIIISIIVLIGIVIIVKSTLFCKKSNSTLCDSNNKCPYTDDEIKNELKNASPTLIKMEIGSLYAKAIELIVAAFVAYLVVLQGLLKFIVDLMDGKITTDISFSLDLGFYLMMLIICIGFTIGGIEKIVFAKRVKKIFKETELK